MPCSARDVAAHAARELERIADADVREGLRSRLMVPEEHLREWDYGAPGERYPCWTVAADPESDSAIVYSEHGFGPEMPWGIVSLSEAWFGMDSGWFRRLEDAFTGSMLAGGLPIWNVVAEAGAGSRATVATSLTMDDAYAIRDDLARRDPTGRYHVLYRSRSTSGIQ
jgi:hypothetical protein